MDGKTHAVVGALTAVAVAHPETVSGYLFAASVGIVGGLFCDVDSKKSKGTKALQNTLMAITTAAVVVVMCNVLKLGITVYFREFMNYYRLSLIGLFGLVAMGVVGTRMPHRQVTHSIEFIAIAAIFAALISREFGVLFAVGAASHVALDALNRKPVKISLLLNVNICLDLCSSSSRTSNAIATLAAFVLVAYPVTLFI